MSTLPILIDHGLTAGMFWLPYQEGWLLRPDGFELAERVTSDTVRARNAVALVDSIAAAELLDTYIIVRGYAIASRRESMLTMVTHTRPDEVDDVTVSTAAVSATGRALARAVIPEFYGIRVAGWTDEPLDVDETTVLITEGVQALRSTGNGDHFHEDLGRAWFLLTDTSYVSHVVIVPRSALTSDPESVQASLRQLGEVLEVSREHGRELRRNISKDRDLDRETVTAVFSDQIYELGEVEQRGLELLYQRSSTYRDVDRLRSSIIDLKDRS